MEENKINKSFAGIYRDEIGRFTGSLRLFLRELISTVNFADNPDFMFNNKPFPLKRGQLVTSLKSLSDLTGYSVQNIRTMLKNLSTLGILTDTSTNILTNKARLITIVDIDKWLVKQSELTNTLTHQLTDGQQTGNRRVTTNNNNNNDNNESNNDKQINKRFQKPSIEEIEAYCKERGNTINATKFYNYYESNGWKVGKNPMKNWKAAIITWEGNGYSQKGKMSIDVI